MTTKQAKETLLLYRGSIDDGGRGAVVAGDAGDERGAHGSILFRGMKRNGAE